jgi:hypothetical protein
LKKEMSKVQLETACGAASLWFVGLYMETFLHRINELRDRLQKTKLVEEIYNNGKNTFDRDIGGTVTRVNSLKRLIEGGRVKEALEKVIYSKTNNPDAVEKANNLLKKIESGEFIIPE